MRDHGMRENGMRRLSTPIHMSTSVHISTGMHVKTNAYVNTHVNTHGPNATAAMASCYGAHSITQGTRRHATLCPSPTSVYRDLGWHFVGQSVCHAVLRDTSSVLSYATRVRLYACQTRPPACERAPPRCMSYMEEHMRLLHA